MQYALIDAAGTVLRYEEFTILPPALAPEKGLKRLTVEDIRPDPGMSEILEGPLVTVVSECVTRVWTIRPKTFPERLAEVHAARRGAYPAVGDQLDALYKARAGDPTALVAVDAAIDAVKAAHPKPVA